MKTKVMTYVLLALITGCTTAPTREEIAKLDYGSCPTDYAGKIKSNFKSGLLTDYSGDPMIWPPRKYWYKEAPIKGGKLLAGYLVPVSVNQTRGNPQFLGHHDYGFLFKNDELLTKLNPLQMRSLRIADAVGPIPKDDREWKKGHSAAKNNQTIIEWVPPGETVQNWSELVTLHMFHKPSRSLTPKKLAELPIEDFKKTCANVTQNIISSTNTDILFERTTTSCAPARDEYSIIKVVKGFRSMSLITYASTTPISKTARKKWIKHVGDAHLMNTCEKKL